MLAALALGACTRQPARFRYGPESEATATPSETTGPAFDPVRMERTMVEMGCTACHTFHGERLVGPPLGGRLGDTRTLADGTTVAVDIEYLTESILAPERRIVAGYEPVMPTYAELIDEPTAERMAAYLLSLR